MITNTMKKWLETEYPAMLKKNRLPIKCHVYLNRLQRRIERELRMALWLAINYPDVFLGKSKTLNKYGNVHHARDKTKERLKILLLTIKALNPKVEVELTKEVGN